MNRKEYFKLVSKMADSSPEFLVKAIRSNLTVHFTKKHRILCYIALRKRGLATNDLLECINLVN